MSEITCFQISELDNVAVLLDDAHVGDVVKVIGPRDGTVALVDDIVYGHKVSINHIQEGQDIVKYGIPIGKATRDIAVGESVHLHNCASQYDERSANFDHKTGAAVDTNYE